MRIVTEMFVTIYRYVMWALILIAAIFIILFAVRYKVMINTQSRIMAYTDTIASYIQKNGGLTLPEGENQQAFFRKIAAANQVTENVCGNGDCLTDIQIDDSTNQGQNRSRVYTVTTRYSLLMPTVPWFSRSRGTSAILKGPDQTRPIISRAYVTEYRNY